MVERPGSADPTPKMRSLDLLGHLAELFKQKTIAAGRLEADSKRSWSLLLELIRQLRPVKFPLRPLDEFSIAVENLYRRAALVDI
jgi:hypothetical protein